MNTVRIISVVLILLSFSFGVRAQKNINTDSLIKSLEFKFIARVVSRTTGDLQVRYYHSDVENAKYNPQASANLTSTLPAGSPYLKDFYTDSDNLPKSNLKAYKNVVLITDKKGIISYAPFSYYPDGDRINGAIFLDRDNIKWKARKKSSGKWLVKMFYPVSDRKNENRKMFLEVNPDMTATLTVASAGQPTLFYKGHIQ